MTNYKIESQIQLCQKPTIVGYGVQIPDILLDEYTRAIVCI
ncbi:hypothetical protein [Pontibacter sp. Tf4]|nr:hypothetical protein [Pontibacter sp. Tf4]